jgi:shikimate kinase
MKLVILFGPPAVGKMTVGQELAKATGLKLFHYHVTIELVLNFFEFGTKEFSRLNSL